MCNLKSILQVDWNFQSCPELFHPCSSKSDIWSLGMMGLCEISFLAWVLCYLVLTLIFTWNFISSMNSLQFGSNFNFLSWACCCMHQMETHRPVVKAFVIFPSLFLLTLDSLETQCLWIVMIIFWWLCSTLLFEQQNEIFGVYFELEKKNYCSGRSISEPTNFTLDDRKT